MSAQYEVSSAVAGKKCQNNMTNISCKTVMFNIALNLKTRHSKLVMSKERPRPIGSVIILVLVLVVRSWSCSCKNGS